MMQRIRGAIDRTIAEEQARQNGTGDGGSLSRSGSTASRPGAAGRKSRDKNGGADATDAPPNPDPAVFEAAFVLDDSDDPSRSATPKPPVPEKDASTQNNADKQDDDKTDKDASAAKPKPKSTGDAAGEKPSAQQGLSPEIKQKLRKLEKLEATYPGTQRCSLSTNLQG